MTNENARTDSIAALGHDFAASEDSVRLLVDNLHEYAILVLDPEGRILTWNQGAELLKGYSADEVIGATFRSSIRPKTWNPASQPANSRRSRKKDGWKMKAGDCGRTARDSGPTWC